MLFLRMIHCEGLRISLLLNAIQIYYNTISLPKCVNIYINNNEIMRRRCLQSPKLGVKKYLVLVYDPWSTKKWLQKSIPCTISWKWFKGHQSLQNNKWRIDVIINNFFDKKAEMVRALIPQKDTDPFSPDQICELKWGNTRGVLAATQWGA